jgi:hypothetical protein
VRPTTWRRTSRARCPGSWANTPQANSENWNARAVDYRCLAERLRTLHYLPRLGSFQPPEAARPCHAQRDQVLLAAIAALDGLRFQSEAGRLAERSRTLVQTLAGRRGEAEALRALPGRENPGRSDTRHGRTGVRTLSVAGCIPTRSVGTSRPRVPAPAPAAQRPHRTPST